MGWRRWPVGSDKEGFADGGKLHDTQQAEDVLASLFNPAHRSIIANSTDADAPLSRKSQTAAEAAHSVCVSSSPSDKVPSDKVPSPKYPNMWWEPLVRWRRVRQLFALPPRTPVCPSPPTYPNNTKTVPWTTLPDSPLAGYKLTSEGVLDSLSTPHHVLSATELRGLIEELTGVEQQAKFDVDRQFSGNMGRRGLHGIELLISPALFLTALYLMTWKTAQLYRGALPQQSVLFTRAAALLQWRLSATEREFLAQRHRRLMRATNARVTLSFLSGACIFGVAWLTRPSPNVMEDAPDMQAAKQAIAYQRHTEAALKWCWYVYYHHPAYISTPA